MERTTGYLKSESERDSKHPKTCNTGPKEANNRIAFSKKIPMEERKEAKLDAIDMLIHGLDPETSFQELQEYLSQRCEYSKLKIKINKDGLEDAVYARFSVQRRSVALNLILSSGVLRGRMVYCDYWHAGWRRTISYRGRRLVMRNLSKNWSDKKIHNEILKYGNIRAAYAVKDPWTSLSKGYGYIDFFTTEDRKVFVEIITRNQIKMSGRRIEFKLWDEKACNIGDDFTRGSKVQAKVAKVKQCEDLEFMKVSNKSPEGTYGDVQANRYRHEGTKTSSLGVKGLLRRQALEKNRFAKPKPPQPTLYLKHAEAAGSKDLSPGDNKELKEQDFLAWKRQKNLELIGIAMRQRNLFSVQKGKRAVNKVLHLVPSIKKSWNSKTEGLFLNIPKLNSYGKAIITKEPIYKRLVNQKRKRKREKKRLKKLAAKLKKIQEELGDPTIQPTNLEQERRGEDQEFLTEPTRIAAAFRRRENRNFKQAKYRQRKDNN